MVRVLICPARGARTDERSQILQRDLQRRVGRRGIGGQALRLLARAVQLLDGHELALRELVAPRQIGLGALPVGDGAPVRGHSLVDLQPVPLGVDARQDLRRPHAVARLKRHFLRRPADLGGDLNQLLRFQRSERLNLIYDVVGGDCGGADGETSATLVRCRRAVCVTAGEGEGGDKGSGEQDFESCWYETPHHEEARIA